MLHTTSPAGYTPLPEGAVTLLHVIGALILGKTSFASVHR